MSTLKHISKTCAPVLVSALLTFMSCSGSEMDKFQANQPRDPGTIPPSIPLPGHDLYDILISSNPVLADSFGDVDLHTFSQYVYDFIPEYYDDDMSLKRKYMLNMLLRAQFLGDPYRETNSWWDGYTIPWIHDDSKIEYNVFPEIIEHLKDVANRINSVEDDVKFPGPAEGTRDAFPGWWPEAPEYIETNFHEALDIIGDLEVNIGDELMEVSKKSMYYMNDTYGIKDVDGNGYDTYGIGWKGLDLEGGSAPETLGTLEQKLRFLIATMKDSFGRWDGGTFTAADPTVSTFNSGMDVMGSNGAELMLRSNNDIWVTNKTNPASGYTTPGTGDDTGLGNFGRGIDAFITGVYEFLENEAGLPEDESASKGSDFLSATAPAANGAREKSYGLLRNFLEVLEDYQTEDGAKFASGGGYRSLNTDNARYYNAEMRNFILDFFPILQTLMINGKNPASALQDHMGYIDQDLIDDYPFALMCDMINNDHSKGEKGLNIDIDNYDIAGSMHTLLRYDAALRDRVGRGTVRDNPWAPNAKPYAEKWSMMEKMCWIMAALDHFGFTAAAWESSDSTWGGPLESEWPEGGFNRTTGSAYGGIENLGNFRGSACSNKKGSRPFDAGRGFGMHVPYITLADGMYNLRTADNMTMGVSMANMMGVNPGLNYNIMAFDGMPANMIGSTGKKMGTMFTFLGPVLPRLMYNNGNPRLELNVFGLFGDRPPGDSTWMNSGQFTAAQASADPGFRVDVHTNAPVLVLCGGEVTGDLGLPKAGDPLYENNYKSLLTYKPNGSGSPTGIQGGRSYSSSEIVPYAETWIDDNNATAASVERWARVWVPYCEDGMGLITTAQWLFSWLVRAGMMGHAPFYSMEDADEIAGNGSNAKSPGSGIWQIYSPDGKEYGVVDKNESPWVYYKDYNMNSNERDRGKRFKHKWETINWMVKLKGVNKGTRYQGTAKASSSGNTLRDTSASWPAGALNGTTIWNCSNGSHGIIGAGNTATQLTVSSWRTGGTDNDWEPGDVYYFTYKTGSGPDRYYTIDQANYENGTWNKINMDHEPAVKVTSATGKFINYYEEQIYMGGNINIAASNYGMESATHSTYIGQGFFVPTAQGSTSILMPNNEHDKNMDGFIDDEYLTKVYNGSVTPANLIAIDNGRGIMVNPAARNLARGYHGGADNTVTLTDTNKSWTANQWRGFTIYNHTDSSSGRITANTATSVTVILKKGLENDWDAGDIYEIDVGSPKFYENGDHTGLSRSNDGDSNDSAILIDCSKNWESNIWQGLTLNRIAPAAARTGLITSNTKNTITADNGPWHWADGNMTSQWTPMGTINYWNPGPEPFEITLTNNNYLGYVEYAGKIVMTGYAKDTGGNLIAVYYRDPMGSTNTGKTSKGFQVGELVGSKTMFARQFNQAKKDAGDKYPYDWLPNPAFDNGVRECATHEESIYRNLHWFMYEKKFLLAIPMGMKMNSQINMPGSMIYVLMPLLMPGCDITSNSTVKGMIDSMVDDDLGDLSFDGGAAMAMTAESNGAFGLLNLRRLNKQGGSTGNGQWALMQDNPVTTAERENYGYSNIPGDYRLTLQAGGGEVAFTFAMSAVMSGYGVTMNMNMQSEMAYNDIIDIDFAWGGMFSKYGGTMLPAIAVENLDVLYNLIYLIPQCKERCLYGDSPIPGSSTGYGTPYNDIRKDYRLYSTSPELGPRWTSVSNPNNPPPASMAAKRVSEGAYWEKRNNLMPVMMGMLGAWRERMTTKPLRDPSAKTASNAMGGTFSTASIDYPRLSTAMDTLLKGMLPSLIKPVMLYQNDPGTDPTRQWQSPYNSWKFKLEEINGPTPLYFHEDLDGDNLGMSALAGFQPGYSPQQNWARGEGDDINLGDFIFDNNGLGGSNKYSGSWAFASQADYYQDCDFDTDGLQNPNPYQDNPVDPADDWQADPGASGTGGFNGYDYDYNSNMRQHFMPAYRKTIISMMGETPAISAYDPESPDYMTDAKTRGYTDLNGLITLNTDMMRQGMKMMYKLGSSDYNDPADYDPADITKWGTRRKIFYGLEQIMTGAKSTSGDMLFGTGGAPGYKEIVKEPEYAQNLVIPSFLKTLRPDGDIKLSDVLDEFVDDVDGVDNIKGNADDSKKGLAYYPDLRNGTLNDNCNWNNAATYDWDRFNAFFENLKEMTTNNAATGGAYNMSDSLFGIIDKLAEEMPPLEMKHFQAIRLAAATSLAYYDEGLDVWVEPSDMKAISQYMTELMEAFNQHSATDSENQLDGYYALLKVMLGDLKYDGTLGEDEVDWEMNYRWDEGLMKEEGLVEYLLKNFASDKSAHDFFVEIENMLFYLEYEDPFWTDTAALVLEVLDKYNWRDTPDPVVNEYDGDGTSL